jgi:chromate transporter
MSDNVPLALALAFIPLSFMSFGGGISVLPAVQQQAVELHAWITPREFIEMFAIARTAPGPGLMLATLIGWKVAGWVGALITTLAIFVPSSVLCFVVAQAWRKHEGKIWHRAVQQGLAPIGTGLIGAGIISLLDLADAGPVSLATAAATAAVLILNPRISPPIILFSAAAIFAAGSVVLNAQ